MNTSNKNFPVAPMEWAASVHAQFDLLRGDGFLAMPKLIDITGQKFSLLTATHYDGKDKWGDSFWKCKCQCGNETRVLSKDLKRGHTSSCGCLLDNAIFRHGLSNSKEYNAWNKMIQRCSNPKNKAYSHYGARGITVCDRWLVFSNFISDVGMAPNKNLTLERLDNNGNYEPGNCEWATRKDQIRNRRCTISVEFNGKSKTLGEWCEEIGVNYHKTYERIKLGWSVERAFHP